MTWPHDEDERLEAVPEVTEDWLSARWREFWQRAWAYSRGRGVEPHALQPSPWDVRLADAVHRVNRTRSRDEVERLLAAAGDAWRAKVKEHERP